MTKAEKIFDQIVNQLTNGFSGNMFGAKCVKTDKGKTAAFFWQDCMVFKLDQESQKNALRLAGAKTGRHIYAPEKLMKGWVEIPSVHSGTWVTFAESALNFVEQSPSKNLEKS
jgi:hypothetical protein